MRLDLTYNTECNLKEIRNKYSDKFYKYPMDINSKKLLFNLMNSKIESPAPPLLKTITEPNL